MQQLKENHVPLDFANMIPHLNMKYVTFREWLDLPWIKRARFGIDADYIPFAKKLNESFVLADESIAFKEDALNETVHEK
mgnify:CR=1 FL=1